MEGIEELNLDLNKTYLLITHLHADHSGLAAELNQRGAKVYAGNRWRNDKPNEQVILLGSFQ